MGDLVRYAKQAAVAGASVIAALYVLGKVSPDWKAKVLDPTGKS